MPVLHRPYCKYSSCTNYPVRGGIKGICRKHGGGKRCFCGKAAAAPGSRCKAHGGGRRCKTEGCNSSAMYPSYVNCAKHGGGKLATREHLMNRHTEVIQCTLAAPSPPVKCPRTPFDMSLSESRSRQSPSLASGVGPVVPACTDSPWLELFLAASCEPGSLGNHSSLLETFASCEPGPLGNHSSLMETFVDDDDEDFDFEPIILPSSIKDSEPRATLGTSCKVVDSPLTILARAIQ